MNEEETQIICIKGIELERIIRRQEVTMYNAFELHQKYERCFDCIGYDNKCEFFKNQYLGERLS